MLSTRAASRPCAESGRRQGDPHSPLRLPTCVTTASLQVGGQKDHLVLILIREKAHTPTHAFVSSRHIRLAPALALHSTNTALACRRCGKSPPPSPLQPLLPRPLAFATPVAAAAESRSHACAAAAHAARSPPPRSPPPPPRSPLPHLPPLRPLAAAAPAAADLAASAESRRRAAAAALPRSPPPRSPPPRSPPPRKLPQPWQAAAALACCSPYSARRACSPRSWNHECDDWRPARAGAPPRPRPDPGSASVRARACGGGGGSHRPSQQH